MGDLAAQNVDADATHADVSGGVVGQHEQVHPGLCPGERLGQPHRMIGKLTVQAYPAGTHTRALILCVRLLTYFAAML
jgi:hypothetical protein